MTKRLIINGGNPLPGCPDTYESAYEWADKVNGGVEENSAPFWSWDCGFKLDYDGPLVTISSRFYPPKEFYGSTWDGIVSIRLLGKTIREKKFDCPTLEVLHKQVIDFVNKFGNSIEQVLIDTLKEIDTP